MEINRKVKDNTAELAVSGRLDTTTSPELEEVLKDLFEQGVNELVLDFADLEYVSSAGLRVLLFAQKSLNDGGKMTIKNVREEIMEVFDMTGFLDILTVEAAPSEE